MGTAEVGFQSSELNKFLVTILFNTRVRLIKVVNLYHVPLQIDLQSKHLCASWLRASIGLFLVVHILNVFTQILLLAELFQALATLCWLCFVVHHVNVPI